MTRRLKTLTKPVPVPQSDDEAREAIREIGDLAREKARLQTRLNDRIAALQQEYGAKGAPLEERLAARKEGLRTYAEANRDQLTQSGKVKFHRFATGDISWRVRPPKVSVRGKAAVLAAIKEAGLRHFIRTREDLDKEAMLKDRETAGAITGVSIGSGGEDFIVEPSETELEETA